MTAMLPITRTVIPVTLPLKATFAPATGNPASSAIPASRLKEAEAAKSQALFFTGDLIRIVYAVRELSDKIAELPDTRRNKICRN